MRFYTYAKTFGNTILVRGYENGQQVIEKVPFSPTLYIPSKNKKSEWHGLYNNEPLEPVKFTDIKEAKQFVETYKDVQGIEVHGFQRWHYQYINETYPGEVEYDLSLVNILTLDIEVVSEDEDGFPDIEKADVPIVLISLHSTKTNNTIVLGLKDYTPNENDDFSYIKFSSEKALLRYFISYIQETTPDVWTGWNTDQFDIPYIINRIIRLFDESMVKKLSPFGYIQKKTLNVRGRDIQTYEIYGVISLDYLELYRKYGTYSAKESYALGSIAQEELGETKVDMPGKSFRENYNEYFQIFVKYSAIDTVLVKKMDDKLKLISLAFAMSYMYHCNLQDIFKTVGPWEIFIFNHLAAKKIAVPPKRNGMLGAVEGAWVKEPTVGMHGWTLSFDFASLYPSIMRQWNISPETFHGMEFVNIKVKDFLCDKADGARADAIIKNCTIAANGSLYTKDKQGFLPELMEFCMVGRKTAKQEMIKFEKEYEISKDIKLKSKISALNNKQMALKIAANACYGAIGNEGFHYYEYRMAEAITLTGQLSNIHLSNMLNKKMNNVMKTSEIDYIVYGDTDSLYLNCQPIVDLICKDKTRDQIVKFLDLFAEQVCQPVITKSINQIYDDTNCFDAVMSSKREAIASKALFRGKKNYAMYVHNSEGVEYNPPKLKVMGLEIVRSSTPQWCKKKLKECLMMIFETDEITFRNYFAKVENEFKLLSPEEIAFPRGVSDIDKWVIGNQIKKGVPIHVRGALLYNSYAKDRPDFQKIQNGDRTRFIYMKMPNPIKNNVFGFPANNKFPSELTKYVDYKSQFEKTFEHPMSSLTNCAKWSVREQSSLEDFFI